MQADFRVDNNFSKLWGKNNNSYGHVHDVVVHLRNKLKTASCYPLSIFSGTKQPLLSQLCRMKFQSFYVHQIGWAF